jgi:hypothetical protein
MTTPATPRQLAMAVTDSYRRLRDAERPEPTDEAYAAYRDAITRAKAVLDRRPSAFSNDDGSFTELLPHLIAPLPRDAFAG